VLPDQRRERILNLVRSVGGVRVSELVEQLGVSDMTIRRDIEVLAGRGLVARVHGGATTVGDRSADEPGFAAKSAQQRIEKRAIARAAVRLVQPGAAVALSAGTTTYEIARELCAVADLTVVTNSFPAAQLLHEAGRSDLTVVLTGGTRTPSDALVGPVAVEALRGLHVDTVFLGVHGFDERSGFTTPNLVEAETNRALLACARRRVVTADHTKWGVVGLASITGLGDIEVLVVDDRIQPEALLALEKAVPEVLLAPTDEIRAAAPRADDADDGRP
jgi:DeoR/GlpR family transcriptional regulator of sugar metabolism